MIVAVKNSIFRVLERRRSFSEAPQAHSRQLGLDLEGPRAPQLVSCAGKKAYLSKRVVKKRGAFFGRRCQELDFQGSGVPRELPRGTPGAPTGSTRERSPWITLLGLPSWVVSPGIALQGLLSWGFSLLDCSPLDCALLGLLSWDCSAGIFPQGLLSWDCFIILHFGYK